jgi:predicted short-subunit dehydrogenase-like oxidoreductase (DUF2520 family)
MRELERRAAVSPSPKPDASGDSALLAGPRLDRVCVVGGGRLGAPLVAALRRVGLGVDGPFGRGKQGRLREATVAADAVLLCVPDAEIAGVAAALDGAGRFVGHTSGATPLSALSGATGATGGLFGFHPLQTFTGTEEDPAARFEGASVAIAGSTPPARTLARDLAARLGMTPLDIDDALRPAYHAAASVASNFLVTLQGAAEDLAAAAGLTPVQARRALAPLVRSTVDNWARLGPERALTGPITRGDWTTVERQRAAVSAADPGLVPLFDALVDRTRSLAGREPDRAATGVGS